MTEDTFYATGSQVWLRMGGRTIAEVCRQVHNEDGYQGSTEDAVDEAFAMADRIAAALNRDALVAELALALEAALSLVKLKFGNTDDTGNAVIEISETALARAREQTP